MKKIIALTIVGLCIYALIGCQDNTITFETETENNTTDVDDYLVEIAFPDVEGELIELGDGEYKVSVIKKVVDGETHYIMGGDIVLSERQVEILRNRGSEVGVGKSIEIDDIQSGLDPSHSTFTARLVELWPNNTIYYTLNNPPHPQRVLDAISHWNNNTNLTFLPRTNQTKYVEFRSTSSGCRAELGFQNEKQHVWLSSGCTTGNIIHEIGHTVGLFHEHQRSDRGNYINIHTQNINLSSGERKVAFDIYGGRSLSQGFEIGPLDFNSIMMYGPCFFSTSGQNFNCPSGTETITRTNGTTFSIQRNGLSLEDREGVKYLYYPGVYVKLEKVWNQSESFDERENSPNGIGNYLDVFDVTVHFYSNSNFTTPKTLDYPIRFNYRYNCTSFNEGCAHPSGTQTLLIPSGVTSYFVGKDTYRGYDIQYTPQWYARSTIVSRDGIGYN